MGEITKKKEELKKDKEIVTEYQGMNSGDKDEHEMEQWYIDYI